MNSAWRSFFRPHILERGLDYYEEDEVLPYDLAGTMRVALKMENGIRQMLQFLFDSRLTENTAHLLCKKKNVNCIIYKE